MTFLEPGRLRVKICGLTQPDDAQMCLDAGADALGFNFFPGSVRALDPDDAIPWIRDLGDSAARVAVVVNPDPPLLDRLRRAECFEIIQFHGDESPADCLAAGFPQWIRALRISGPSTLAGALAFPTPNLLLDGYHSGAYGGTGLRPDWDLVGGFAAEHPDRRCILAGGLHPDNVSDAIHTVRPHAVDVASGVESAPRKKDPALVRKFLAQAREAGAQR
jgi:phosphoribosylanthranilate isomerase